MNASRKYVSMSLHSTSSFKCVTFHGHQTRVSCSRRWLHWKDGRNAMRKRNPNTRSHQPRTEERTSERLCVGIPINSRASLESISIRITRTKFVNGCKVFLKSSTTSGHPGWSMSQSRRRYHPWTRWCATARSNAAKAAYSEYSLSTSYE